jgi:hypothetical protein
VKRRIALALPAALPVRVLAAATALTLTGGVTAAALGTSRHRPSAITARGTASPAPVSERSPAAAATAPARAAAARQHRSPAPEQTHGGTVSAAIPVRTGGRHLEPLVRAPSVHAPDVLVTAGRSLPAATVQAIGRLPGVTAVSVVDVGTVRVHGARTSVFGVDPATFRWFTPGPSARSDVLWWSVGRGELVTSFDMARELRLPLGRPLLLATRNGDVALRVGAFASTGLPDTDAVVDRSRSAALGLRPRAGVVLAAPHADPVRLRAALRQLLRDGGRIELLRRVVPLSRPGRALAQPVIDVVLRAAMSRLGVPYRWGATGPDAFDCSGLVGWAYRQAGIALPRTAAQLWYAGPHVRYADARPGDLLFWAYDPTAPGFIDHVALYAGNGLMIVAPHTGAVVTLRPVPLRHFMGVVRIVGAHRSA